MNAELKATLGLSWEPLGPVRLDSAGELSFPYYCSQPNLYRISIEKADGSRWEYIGETDNLDRRFVHYRNPSQPTNRRLNRLCKEALSEGGKINIDIVQNAWVQKNGVEKQANFYLKDVRRLFEYFALAEGWSKGIRRLNK